MSADNTLSQRRFSIIVATHITAVTFWISVGTIYVYYRYLKSDRVVILINICIALTVSYVIFLSGVNQTQVKVSTVKFVLKATCIKQLHLLKGCLFLIPQKLNQYKLTCIKDAPFCFPLGVCVTQV